MQNMNIFEIGLFEVNIFLLRCSYFEIPGVLFNKKFLLNNCKTLCLHGYLDIVFMVYLQLYLEGDRTKFMESYVT
jgi:hypothetical protein